MEQKSPILRTLSDPMGNISSMRVAFLLGMGAMVIGFFAVIFGMLWVVILRGEFPQGFWSAVASISGGISALVGGKAFSGFVEQRTYRSALPSPAAPPLPGSEKLED